MSKSTLTNKDLIELLDHYLLVQKKELPAKFNRFEIPEGREGLMKLVQTRLKTVKKPEAEPKALTDVERLMRLPPGWSDLKEFGLPALQFHYGKYATIDLNVLLSKLSMDVLAETRELMLQVIWILLHTVLNRTLHSWPACVADEKVIFTEMVNQLTTKVLHDLLQAEQTVLVIGFALHIPKDVKLVDLDALENTQKASIELNGAFSGWTIQTVAKARFQE